MSSPEPACLLERPTGVDLRVSTGTLHFKRPRICVPVLLDGLAPVHPTDFARQGTTATAPNVSVWETAPGTLAVSSFAVADVIIKAAIKRDLDPQASLGRLLPEVSQSGFERRGSVSDSHGMSSALRCSRSSARLWDRMPRLTANTELNAGATVSAFDAIRIDEVYLDLLCMKVHERKSHFGSTRRGLPCAQPQAITNTLGHKGPRSCGNVSPVARLQ